MPLQVFFMVETHLRSGRLLVSQPLVTTVPDDTDVQTIAAHLQKHTADEIAKVRREGEWLDMLECAATNGLVLVNPAEIEYICTTLVRVERMSQLDAPAGEALPPPLQVVPAA